jgi:Uma2 family endonuclease
VDGAVDGEAATNPVVLIEILSDSTEAFDRGEKFSHYRRLASLREYVLVSPSKPRVEVFRKTDAGTWELFEALPGQAITLASLDARLAVDEVFQTALG